MEYSLPEVTVGGKAMCVEWIIKESEYFLIKLFVL